MNNFKKGRRASVNQLSNMNPLLKKDYIDMVLNESKVMSSFIENEMNNVHTKVDEITNTETEIQGMQNKWDDAIQAIN